MSDIPILLDVSRLIWRKWSRRLPTGIDRVCLAYLDHFGPRSLAVVQFRQFRLVLCRTDSAKLFDLLAHRSDWFRTRLAALLAVAALRGVRRAAGHIYLNVGHTGLNSSFLLPWLKDRGLQPVFLIHDLIPITHPHFCRSNEAERHRVRIKQAMASAKGIIVNSGATERELAEFAGEEGLSMPPCTVAWLGINEPKPPQSPARLASRRPYFILVGTIEARKNHRMVLGLWSDLVERLGADAPELIIVGQRGWEAQSALDVLDNLGPLDGHVRELGRCDDATMNELLAGARALLMPSFAEGFGLPLVEALQLGTPVIASDLAVFREIAGDVPEYLDPADEPGWCGVVLDYVADDSRRSDQLARLTNFQAPRWAQHFVQVDRLLDSIHLPNAAGSRSSQMDLLEHATDADSSITS